MQSRVRQVSPEREQLPSQQSVQAPDSTLPYPANPSQQHSHPSQLPSQQNNVEERTSSTRPIIKLSVSLIQTYRNINAAHEEELEMRRRRDVSESIAQ